MIIVQYYDILHILHVALQNVFDIIILEIC